MNIQNIEKHLPSQALFFKQNVLSWVLVYINVIFFLLFLHKRKRRLLLIDYCATYLIEILDNSGMIPYRHIYCINLIMMAKNELTLLILK